MSWKKLKKADRLKVLNELPTIKLEDVKYPYGWMVYTRWELFRPMSYLSVIIRYVRNCVANHCGTAAYHTLKHYEGLLFTDATERGVRPSRPIDKIRNWKKHGDIVVILVPKKKLDNKEIAFRTETTWNKPYGFFQLVKFLWANITRKPIRSKALRTGKLYVCSTQLMKVLTDHWTWWQCTPKEVWDSDEFVKYRLILK